MRTKIEWCDETFNPTTGCINNCPYCYARKIAMRFDGHFNPTFHLKRLEDGMARYMKMRKSVSVFLGSMTDILQETHYKEGDACDLSFRNGQQVIIKILRFCWYFNKERMKLSMPPHNWIFLSKLSDRFEILNTIPHAFEPNNYWGITIDHPYDCSPSARSILDMKKLKNFFISFEPVQWEEDLPANGYRKLTPSVRELTKKSCCNIIGVETGNRKDKFVPAPDELVEFIRDVDTFSGKIFLKDSIYQTSIMDRLADKNIARTRYLPWRAE